jgi:hypothetical protein
MLMEARTIRQGILKHPEAETTKCSNTCFTSLVAPFGHLFSMMNVSLKRQYEPNRGGMLTGQ